MEYDLYELERWSLLLIGMGFTAGLIGGWILNEIMTEYEQRKKVEGWIKKHKARREKDYLDLIDDSGVYEDISFKITKDGYEGRRNDKQRS